MLAPEDNVAIRRRPCILSLTAARDSARDVRNDETLDPVSAPLVRFSFVSSGTGRDNADHERCKCEQRDPSGAGGLYMAPPCQRQQPDQVNRQREPGDSAV